MTQREVLELVQNAGSLPALTKALKESNADSAYHNWAMRYYLDVKARKRGVPLKGTFEITPLCNLDCKMCYVHLNKAQLKGQTLLPAEDFERIMSEAIDSGTMYACLTGGECMTSPDFDRLYLFLHKKGVQVSVLTNAVLLNEERVEFFKKHPPALIQITLYGASEEDYERVTGRRMFEMVLGNIRRADQALLPITISITPNEYLMDGTEEVIKLA
ncbi:MAG: radical SAM protein, partial [Clostridia bacterium]|nr:radical SAM protein [Clostridia bacterium]